ncbi:g8676 [Coccomyxa elongata]
MGRLLSNFADCICCGRGNRYQSADTWMNQPLNIFQPRSTATLEDLLEKSSRAREAVWQELGSLEPLVLSHLVSPTLSGGPKWPALRQAFRLVRRPNGNVILASDGLSDPFDDITLGDGNVNGFGLEFYIETPGNEIAETIHDVKKSWQFQLLYTVSQLAAGHGGIRAIMDDMKLLSTEAEGVNEAIPEEHRKALVNAAGRVGALLGLQSGSGAEPGSPQENGDADDAGTSMPERIPDMPLTEVKLVNIKLLTLAELKLITDRGAEGRRRLSELFSGPDKLVSSLHRSSAV